MTGAEFARRARAAATDYKTLYVNGCFGAPMTAANKKRYANNTAYNRRPERQAKIYAASANTFGFDCCGLVKALLWGWTGDASQVYGGAVYKANGVPDLSEEGLWDACSARGDLFDEIRPGAFLYTPGHCGIYVGGGMAVEATPKWSDGVQLTAVANLGPLPGYNARTWYGWGLLPWIDYRQPAPDPVPANVKEFNLLCNGKDTTARGIYEAGNWYIRLRDLDERLGIADVSYDAVAGLPVIITK